MTKKIRSQLNHIILFSSVIFLTSVLFSCQKEPDGLGIGVLPGSENFLVKNDTAYDILANTVKIDSTLSFYPDSAIAVRYKSIIGQNSDPIFGETKASLLLNFFPDSTNHTFGATPKVDSLVFFLSYDSIISDKAANMRIKISELNKALSYKEKYYSDIDTNVYKSNIILADTVVQFKDTLLKIKITNADFISRLIQVPASAKESFTNFQQFFKGIYIEALATSQPGVLAYVKPWSYNSYTKLIMYYSNEIKDSLTFYYGSVSRTVRTSKFSHNYAGTPVETALQNNEPGQKVTYVQSLAGVGTRIHISSISKWAEMGPVSINKAELVIPVDVSFKDTASIPKRLSIMGITSSGQYYNIEYGFGQTFIGGLYDKDKKVYTFNLAKHIQKIANSKLSGAEITDFIIVADSYKIGTTAGFSKVPLDFSSGKGAKLNIIYSKQ